MFDLFGGGGGMPDPFGLFGGDADPTGAANGYLDKIAPMLKEYLNPYIQRGDKAYGKMSPVYDAMTDDPTGFMNKIMDGYDQSKGYQLQRDEALRSAGNAAAAGGMRGSLSDIDNSARITDRLHGEDMQRFLQNVLGIQGQGLSGQQGLYNTGFNAASNLSGDLSNVLGQQAQYAFQGQRDKQQRGSDLMSSLMQLGGMAMML